MPNIPVAVVPGHTNVQTKEELLRNILEVTLDDVIENLTLAPEAARKQEEPSARDIVFKGSFDEVNEFFCEKEWSDGLPVVPPTRKKIESFLNFTDRDPNESLGTLLPDSRSATIWSVALNGAMAGCRPEYMPLLIAMIEAMAEEAYGVEHSGNTPGGETLIILNGPMIKELGFNYTQGVMRDGFLPNTSLGRFWRLYLRNVAGFVLHKNDKGCFGNTWRVAMAENEDVLARIGWEPNSVEMGFEAGDNTVMIGRYTGGDVSVSASGDRPEHILDYVADAVRSQSRWQLTFTMGYAYGKLRPLVLLSPVLAETIAKAGCSKADVKRYLYEQTFITARKFDQYTHEYSSRHESFTIAAHAAKGALPAAFTQSDDPDRLVPVLFSPDNFIIVVTGDPGRTNFYTFVGNGQLGLPVGRRIRKRGE